MWLAGVLNAHIERNNVVAGRPLATATPREHGTDVVELHDCAGDPSCCGERPCWVCGDPAGFHVDHRPCWDVPPFTRNAVPTMRTFADGGLL